jgi:hypothetical protein
MERAMTSLIFLRAWVNYFTTLQRGGFRLLQSSHDGNWHDVTNVFIQNPFLQVQHNIVELTNSQIPISPSSSSSSVIEISSPSNSSAVIEVDLPLPTSSSSIPELAQQKIKWSRLQKNKKFEICTHQHNIFFVLNIKKTKIYILELPKKITIPLNPKYICINKVNGKLKINFT